MSRKPHQSLRIPYFLRKAWSVKREAWNVKREAWSVKREAWSVKRGV